jgi:hypothetical protein
MNLTSGDDRWAVDDALRVSQAQIRQLAVWMRPIDGPRDESEIAAAFLRMYGRRALVKRASEGEHNEYTIRPQRPAR